MRWDQTSEKTVRRDKEGPTGLRPLHGPASRRPGMKDSSPPGAARSSRSCLKPMKKVARMLQAHHERLLNWFRAQGELVNRRCRGFEQEDSCGNQTILWPLNLPSHAMGLLARAWSTC